MIEAVLVFLGVWAVVAFLYGIVRLVTGRPRPTGSFVAVCDPATVSAFEPPAGDMTAKEYDHLSKWRAKALELTRRLAESPVDAEVKLFIATYLTAGASSRGQMSAMFAERHKYASPEGRYFDCSGLFQSLPEDTGLHMLSAQEAHLAAEKQRRQENLEQMSIYG